MSDDFFGRPISEGMEELEFELCEICQRKSPNWLEIKFEDEIPAIRFACTDCHQEYKDRKEALSPDISRQIDDEEELPSTTRPGWVDDFIQEQNEAGAIESIDSQPEPKDAKETSEIQFSEAPEEFQDRDQSETEGSYVPKQIAGWAPKFIQEALFGPNPEQWLEENGGYNENVLDITIRTLGSFADHDISSVKLSAIQCLLGLFNRHGSQASSVLSELKKYENDIDEAVSDFAIQTKKQIQ